MKAVDFFFASRPLLHLPVWSTYLVSLHLHHQINGGQFEWEHLLTMISLSLIAAGAYYINQIHDIESDRINDKLGFLQRGILTRYEMMILFFVVSILSLAGAALVSTMVLAIFLIEFPEF